MPNWNSIIVSLEQGDDDTRVLLVTRDGRVVGAAQTRHRRLVAGDGRIEYDPRELWYQARKVIASGLDIHRTLPGEVAAVAITSPGQTVAIWNRETGECYCNILGEPDDRGDDIPLGVRGRLAELVPARTGHKWSATLPIAKLIWLLGHIPGLTEAAAGEAIYGCGGSWLLWHLTGSPVMDPAAAEASGMWNLESRDWDDEILSEARIPRSLLPPVFPKYEGSYPLTIAEGPFDGSVRVGAVLPEVHAALFGLGCEREQDAGCAAVFSGRVFLNLGSAVPSGPDLHIEPVMLRASAGTSDPVRFVSSSIAPAKSQVDGIEEGLKSIEERTGVHASRLRVSGPLALDDSEMQALADNLKIPVERARFPETAAYGAALAAGQAAGFWENEAEARAIWQVDRTFEPNKSEIGLR